MSISLKIINDDTIENFHSLYSSQILDIENIPNILAVHKLVVGGINPVEDNRPSQLQDRNIIDLSERLKNLKRNLDQYRPGLIMRIINFIIGKFFRLRRLKNCLENVIKVVDIIAKKTAFYQREIAGKGAADVSDDDEEEVEKAAFQKVAGDKKIPQSAAAPKDASDEPVGRPSKGKGSSNDVQHTGDGGGDVEDIDDEDFDLPSAIAKKNPKLAEKHKLVTRAWKQINLEIAQYDDAVKKGMNLPYNVAAAKKIKLYFQGLLKKSMQGHNFALSRFYHSTKEKYLDSIFASQAIEQRDGLRGNGAFISTNDEGTKYGPHSFGIDTEAVENTQAHYFLPANRATEGNKEPSVWVCIKADIVVSPKTIGCMVTTSDKVNALQLKLKAKKNGWENVPVFSREEALEMRTVLETVDHKRSLPSNNWFFDYHDQDLNYHMPHNMKHVVRQYTPKDWEF